MDDKLRKILKKIVGEGYKLKAHHNDLDWKNALESAESLLIDTKDKRTLDNLDDYYIDELVDIRSKARNNKDWELADKLRNYLDTKSVIIMDTKSGQEVHYLLKNQTREDLVNSINIERKAVAQHDAWLYSINKSAESNRKDHKVIKTKKNYREVDGILIEKNESN
jgi:hypothetical protein